MKRYTFSDLFALLGVLVCSVSLSLAQEKAPECKILIITGGHDFDVKEFYEMFDAMPGIVYETAELPKDMDLLAPGLEKKYDAIVSYDMNRFPITDEQRTNYEKLLQNGMPLLVFHHSICGYDNWPTYCEIAGGTYLHKDTEIEGKIYPPSDFKHGVDMEIAIADKKHPITKGLDGFTIHDEAYKNVYVCDDVHVLLTCDDPLSTKQIAWTHSFGKSPIFTIMLGHDKLAFGNENLRTLLKQGIEWLVAEKNNVKER